MKGQCKHLKQHQCTLGYIIQNDDVCVDCNDFDVEFYEEKILAVKI